jgi:hypothetical protein
VIQDRKEQLDKLAAELDTYVETRKIHSVKYQREAERWKGRELPGLCVYYDDREKEEVRQILLTLRNKANGVEV